MNITLFTNDEHCKDIVQTKVAHITMFKDQQLELHFIIKEEMLKLINKLIENYVLFKCQGMSIYLIPEANNFQRVRYRFDS